MVLAIVCRTAPVGRFPQGRSLANFLGLTPGGRSSGEIERPGSITKVGSLNHAHVPNLRSPRGQVRAGLVL